MLDLSNFCITLPPVVSHTSQESPTLATLNHELLQQELELRLAASERSRRKRNSPRQLPLPSDCRVDGLLDYDAPAWSTDSIRFATSPARSAAMNSASSAYKPWLRNLTAQLCFMGLIVRIAAPCW